ncbi:DUF1552 domain-containing protein [Stenotrophomonas sp. B1-1]|uniref:DUF1552 domain-containing protein n=1 Tax=Stenotrophomonas sp. B1-1 TaxID=2710648 RepID=UPI0013DBD636|nr:DUF1552 domain-containing protein [Stenotrophomonas sp. B1-1]
MSANSIFKGRRRFLLASAAATAAIAGGGYFLSRDNLVRMATAGRDVREGVKHKVIFVVVADGLATTQSYAGYSPPPAATLSEIQEQGQLPLWHPWDGEFGKSPFNDYTLGERGWDSENFVLGTVSSELEKYRGRSLYLRGVRGHTTNDGHAGHTHILRDNADSGRSIDQIMGDALQGLSRSGALYAGDIRHNKTYLVSWAGRGLQADIEMNPMALFASVYPGMSARGTRDVGGASLLDPAMEDLKEIKGGLTGPEMQKLESHLQAAAQVKDQLESGKDPPESCNPEEGRPEWQDQWLSDLRYRSNVLRGQAMVIASALACGMTRVATFQVGASSEETNLYYEDGKSIGNAHQSAHHAVLPDKEDGRENYAPWRDARVWYVRRVRELLDELDKYADPDVPDDSLLDHTLVVVTSELSDGLPEHRRDMPMLLVGGEKSFGTMTGSGKGRAYNVRWQCETAAADQYQDYKDQVRTSRVFHTIAAAAGVASGFDAESARAGAPVEVLRGLFEGVGDPIRRT